MRGPPIAALGAGALSSVAPLPASAVLAGGATVHMAFGMREMGLLRFRMPESHWQVPRRWLATMSPWAVALAWGGVLGAGVFTRITTGTFYVVAAWVFALSSPLAGVLLLSMFGAGRALSLVTLAAITHDVDDAGRWTQMLGSWHAVILAANALTLTASGAWLLSGLLH